jgi:aminoglycoside phosphotransferase (APT) family kinase protein
VRALRDRLLPGGRVVAVRALRGGVSSNVHAVRLEGDDGTRHDLVVRTYGPDWTEDPAACGREFRLLGVLAAHGLAAPQPVLLDQDGDLFGGPTLVISRLPGRGMLRPRRLDTYLQELADALVQVHRVPLAEVDFLPRRPPRVERGPSSDDPLEAAVWAALRGLWPAVERGTPPRALIHGDYWPGNTIWHRARLSGVVDWEMAQVDDPVRDVATCRTDLAVLFGPEAAADFTRRFEQARGAAVEGLAFWDLYVVALAMRWMAFWAVGYQALGRQDLDEATAQARLAAYARLLLA